MIYALEGRRLETRGDFWIADNATVIGSVVLGERASIWFNAVVRADNDVITIGDESNVQDGAVLHVDHGVPLTLGRNVTVGHLAMLHGCTVGDDSLIGIGAIVLNRARIGARCIIGAGALVPEGMEVPDDSLVLGAPAKVVREATDAHKAMARLGGMHYVAHSRHYREHLVPDERFHGQ